MEALRRRGLDSVGAEVFEKRATATGLLIKQLEQMSEASVRLGDVLIVKAELDGKTHLIVETISPTLSRELEAQPTLNRDPKLLLVWLDSKKGRRLLKGTGTKTRPSKGKVGSEERKKQLPIKETRERTTPQEKQAKEKEVEEPA